MTNILSCSIPAELMQFLDDNPEVSPSKVLQQGLYQIKEEEGKQSERLKATEIRLFRTTNKLNNVLRYCEEQKFIIPANVLE